MKCKYMFSLFLLLIVFAAANVFAQSTDEGVALYEKGEYSRAAEALAKAAETDKTDKKARLYLGMSYARLKKRKEAVRAFAEAEKIAAMNLAENETPPKILSKLKVGYTEEARANQFSGTVKVAIELGADGTVKFVFPFQTLPGGLTEKVTEAARKLAFGPARRGDQPIPFITTLEYNFSIH